MPVQTPVATAIHLTFLQVHLAIEEGSDDAYPTRVPGRIGHGRAGRFGRTRRQPGRLLDLHVRRQKAMTPADALKELKDGNARFVAGQPVNCDLRAQIKATAMGQFPIAAVVGCIDSRVPPELVFDQKLGDIFAARIAGNFVNTDIIGSLEFATKVSGAKLIVVVGHTECGAIKGAIDHVKLGNLTAMLENFAPALAATSAVGGERNSSNKKLVRRWPTRTP